MQVQNLSEDKLNSLSEDELAKETQYAGIELPRLDPQGDWVTVEELRTILHKEVEDFYKKLKCDGKKETKMMDDINKNRIQTRLYEGRIEDRGFMSKEEALSFLTKYFNTEADKIDNKYK